jgi:hypothetical protein
MKLYLMNIFKKIFSSEKKIQGFSENNLDFEVTPSEQEVSSMEQIDFANGAIEILNPLMRQFGFKLLKLKITEYGTTIIWLKGKCYADLRANTHPHDAPAYYGIALGEFNGDHYHYSELDSVGFWRLKALQIPLDSIDDTPFPFGENIKPSLIKTSNDLLRYAKNFLEGDLTQFYYARSKQWNK